MIPRGGLTKEMILDTAMGLVDAKGLEAVTIRAIADELGVSSMGLYRHVRTKEEILDGLGELARGLLAASVDSSATWDRQLHQVFDHMHNALLEHPGVVQILLAQPRSGTTVYRMVETLLDSMCAAGFAAEDALQEITSLESYTLGFSVQQRSHAALKPESRRSEAEVFAAGDYPILARTVPAFATWASEERFVVGLDRAIERLRREFRNSRRRSKAAAQTSRRRA